MSEQLDSTINHDFVGSGKQQNFGPHLYNVFHQYFKLEIEPAVEKSSAYATILVAEFVFVSVISNTISMIGITDKA